MNKTEKHLEESIRLTNEFMHKLHNRITSLEDTTKNILKVTPTPYVEFDCPICKHTTLAKNYTDKFYVGFRSVTSVNNDKVYCFSCGKTFQMEEKKVWKEVK